MKIFNFCSNPGPLRRAAIIAILAAAAGCFAVPAWAGPKGTIHVRPLGDGKLTIDGDISDWPLAQFKKVAEQPVFPAGQDAASTAADGDHLVFDKTRIGLFNGTTDEAFQANDSDFGVTTYFAYDATNLFILAVFIDDTFRDDNDTTEFGSTGYLNDGFEFFLDAKGDSTDCISDDGFPNIDQAEPNIDDFQVTVGINSTFKPAGSPDNVLGARQNVERAGNLDFIGADKGGPGGIYRDQLDAGPGPDIAARKYDDLRAAGALNPEIAAKPNVKFTGYSIEMRVPLDGKIPDVVANHAMGFEIFWRDVDGEADPGAGGNISWASWAQSTAVDCGDPKTSLFHTANWGQLVFDTTDPLVPSQSGGSSPVELGQTVNGFQDDFTGATRDPNWVPRGPAGDIYIQAGGLLSIGLPTGDPNHLLYEAPGYSNTVQEVLARMRVTAFGPQGDFPRGGLGVGVGTNSQGINLNFRDSVQDSFGRHFRLLDDLRAWGPGTNIDWEIGDWFWVRLKQETNAAGGTADVFAKIWPADGVSAEPAQPQVTWNYVPERTVRAGFAGITGSSSQTGVGTDKLEVDYVLIKAAGLPQITVNFSPLPPETPGGGPTISIARSANDAVITFTGTLEAADAVNGPYTEVAGATSPRTVPLSSATAKFYRARQ